MDWITRNIVRIAIGLVAVVLLLGFLQVRSCQADRQRAAQSRVDRGQGEAFKGSAEDAINATGNVSANDMATADLDRSNRKEIENAKGADAVPDADVAAAGLRALCRRAANRNRPECRVQQPHP